MMDVRVLNAADAAAFQAVRLRALQEHPEAFGASYEEEREFSLDKVAQGFNPPDSVMFGAFDRDALVGIAHLGRYTRMKTRHRAIIGAMYVAPEARGKQVGKALIDVSLFYARTLDGLEDVVLAVTVGNDTARNLYIKAGFTPFSIDPRYIRLGDRYFDIEWMVLRIV